MRNLQVNIYNLWSESVRCNAFSVMDSCRGQACNCSSKQNCPELHSTILNGSNNGNRIQRTHYKVGARRIGIGDIFLHAVNEKMVSRNKRGCVLYSHI